MNNLSANEIGALIRFYIVDQPWPAPSRIDRVIELAILLKKKYETESPHWLNDGPRLDLDEKAMTEQ
jgi:hypothetical protein